MLPKLDENGLLMNPGAWNESVARELALREGLGALTADHWQIIHSLRDHYVRFNAVSAMNLVCRAHGRDWHWAHELFPTCLGAWRIAGLPDPGEEAKSYLSGM